MERIRKKKIYADASFAPAPYYQELFKKEMKEAFDELPANHRTFIRSLIFLAQKE